MKVSKEAGRGEGGEQRLRKGLGQIASRPGQDVSKYRPVRKD